MHLRVCVCVCVCPFNPLKPSVNICNARLKIKYGVCMCLYDITNWERKILRKIFGATNDKDGWRMRTKIEIQELLENEDKDRDTRIVQTPRYSCDN
jgi:hypothetical protein